MTRREIPIDDSDESTVNNHSEEEEMSREKERNGGAAEDVQGEGVVEERIEKLEQENRQLRDQMLRAVADLDNYRRRVQQEREQTVLYANERLLRDILPIVDDFERSVEAGGKTKDFDSFFRGVEMVNSKLRTTLERIGVQRIETIGKPFDVEFHEAIARLPSDAPEDTVTAEVEPGYMYNDRVLRHAKVVVSAGV